MSSEMTTRRAMFSLILLLLLILLRVNQKLIEARKFESNRRQYSGAFQAKSGTIWNICSQVLVKEGNFVVHSDLEMF